MTKQGLRELWFVCWPSVGIVALGAALVLIPCGALHAQAPGGLPSDLVPIAASDIPRSVCNYYSVQQPWMPPCPDNWLSGCSDIALYVSPSVGTNIIFVGDQDVDYAQLAAEAQVLDLAARAANGALSLEGGSGPMSPESAFPDGSLWLSISQLTNGTAPLTLHNTAPEVLYEVLSRPMVPNGTEASEGTVLGAANQDWTPVAIATGDRTNELYFRARSWTAWDAYGVPWVWYVQHGLSPLTPEIGGQDANSDGVLNYQHYLWGSDPQAAEGFSVWVSSPAGYSGIP